jgi:hypothetical protein
MTWSPVTESNRRPSPYHAGRHRLAVSYQVEFLEVRGDINVRIGRAGSAVIWSRCHLVSHWPELAQRGSLDGKWLRRRVGTENPVMAVDLASGRDRVSRLAVRAPHVRALSALVALRLAYLEAARTGG